MAVEVLSSSHSREPFFVRLRRLSVSSRLRRVLRSNSMVLAALVNAQLGNMLQGVFLGFVQIAHQRAGCLGRQAVFVASGPAETESCR